jgi:acyl-CoA synthetase (AMP-forming)/AMP-acid ligase II
MKHLAHVGEMLTLYARLFPDKIGASDLDRKMTFCLWHGRACRLANAFAGMGLGKGDRVCVLAYNCVEWLELYAAAALAGVVAAQLVRHAAVESPACPPPTTSTAGSRSAYSAAARLISNQFGPRKSREYVLPAGVIVQAAPRVP